MFKRASNLDASAIKSYIEDWKTNPSASKSNRTD